MRTTMSVFALASCQDSPAPPLSSDFRYHKSYLIPSYKPLDLRLPSLIASINMERCVAALLATRRWGTLREKTTVSFGSEI